MNPFRLVAAAVLLVLPMGCLTTRATTVTDRYRGKIPYMEVTLLHWEW